MFYYGSIRVRSSVKPCFLKDFLQRIFLITIFSMYSFLVKPTWRREQTRCLGCVYPFCVLSHCPFCVATCKLCFRLFTKITIWRKRKNNTLFTREPNKVYLRSFSLESMPYYYLLFCIHSPLYHKLVCSSVLRREGWSHSVAS